LYWSSTKCKRVTRAVLVSKLYAITVGIDIAISISTTLNLIIRQLGIDAIPTVIYTDSFSLYEYIVKLGTIREKRLIIDIIVIRQSYERRELSKIRWITSESNLADTIIKSAANKALESLISNNRLSIKVQGWVQRPRVLPAEGE